MENLTFKEIEDKLKTSNKDIDELRAIRLYLFHLENKIEDELKYEYNKERIISRLNKGDFVWIGKEDHQVWLGNNLGVYHRLVQKDIVNRMIKDKLIILESNENKYELLKYKLV